VRYIVNLDVGYVDGLPRVQATLVDPSPDTVSEEIKFKAEHEALLIQRWDNLHVPCALSIAVGPAPETVRLYAALNTLAAYSCVDYKTVSASSFFQERLGISADTAESALVVLEEYKYLERSMGQTWITEDGLIALEIFKE